MFNIVASSIAPATGVHTKVFPPDPTTVIIAVPTREITAASTTVNTAAPTTVDATNKAVASLSDDIWPRDVRPTSATTGPTDPIRGVCYDCTGDSSSAERVTLGRVPGDVSGRVSSEVSDGVSSGVLGGVLGGVSSGVPQTVKQSSDMQSPAGVDEECLVCVKSALYKCPQCGESYCSSKCYQTKHRECHLRFMAASNEEALKLSRATLPESERFQSNLDTWNHDLDDEASHVFSDHRLAELAEKLAANEQLEETDFTPEELDHFKCPKFLRRWSPWWEVSPLTPSPDIAPSPGCVNRHTDDDDTSVSKCVVEVVTPLQVEAFAMVVAYCCLYRFCLGDWDCLEPGVVASEVFVDSGPMFDSPRRGLWHSIRAFEQWWLHGWSSGGADVGGVGVGVGCVDDGCVGGGVGGGGVNRRVMGLWGEMDEGQLALALSDGRLVAEREGGVGRVARELVWIFRRDPGRKRRVKFLLNANSPAVHEM